MIVSQMLDPNGANPKDRPDVVVTPTIEIQPNAPLFVVAVSTLLPGPVPPDHVELPWDRRGHAKTGLKSRCAAVIPWLQRIEPDRVLREIGFVPGQALESMACKLNELRERS